MTYMTQGKTGSLDYDTIIHKGETSVEIIVLRFLYSLQWVKEFSPLASRRKWNFTQ